MSCKYFALIAVCFVLLPATAIAHCADSPSYSCSCVPYNRLCHAAVASSQVLYVDQGLYAPHWLSGCNVYPDIQYALNVWKTSPHISDGGRGNMPSFTLAPTSGFSDFAEDGINTVFRGQLPWGTFARIRLEDDDVTGFISAFDIKMDLDNCNYSLYPSSPCATCELYPSSISLYLGRAIIHELGHYYHGAGEATCGYYPESIMSLGMVLREDGTIGGNCYLQRTDEQVFYCDGDAADQVWADPIPVQMIDSLLATPGPASGQITVSWNVVGIGTDFMHVERSIDGSVDYDFIASIDYVEGTEHYEFVDSGLTTNGPHYYRIRAIYGGILTQPVWAVPLNAPGAPPSPIPAPGPVVVESAEEFDGKSWLSLSYGSPFVYYHELAWGPTEALGNSVILQPEMIGTCSFVGTAGQVYYVAGKGIRSSEQSPLSQISSFVLPVNEYMHVVNGGFESGQYGWNPAKVWASETQTGQSTLIHGFTPGFTAAIAGAKSGFVRSTASTGEARRAIEFQSPFISVRPALPFTTGVLRFAYKARYVSNDVQGAADWRIDASIGYYNAALQKIGESSTQSWNAGVTGLGNQTTGSVWKTVPAGLPPANADFFQAEIEVMVHAKGGGQGAEAWALVDEVEFRLLDQTKSSIVMHHGGPAINPHQPAPPNFAQIGGCPANTDASDHPGGTTGEGVASDLWLELTLKDTSNNAVPDVSDVLLDFSQCDGAPTHYNLPSAAYVDAPTDANGKARILQDLSFGGADPCSLSLKVAGHEWRAYSGLRSPDINGDGCVAIQDLSAWQQAWMAGGPVWKCDLSLDNYQGCAIQDLGMLQMHMEDGPGCPDSFASAGSPGSEEVQEGENLAGNDRAILYLHIGDRLPEGAPPPVVPPGSAVGQVGNVGPGGRDMTIWLFASEYSDMRGVHARCDWPMSWQLDDVSEVLPGQIFAHPVGFWRERSEFMTAFDCVSGGRPVAVGRFDVHVTEAGGVRLSIENPIARIVDCRTQMTVLQHERAINGERGDGFAVSAQRPEKVASAPMVLSLSRVTPIVNSAGAEFTLTVPAVSDVTARVFDVSGRVVEILHDHATLAAGPHALRWNATSARGHRVGSGVYTLEVVVDGKRFLERMIILR